MMCKSLLSSRRILFFLTLSLSVLSSRCISGNNTAAGHLVKACKVEDKTQGSKLVGTVATQAKFMEYVCKTPHFKEAWALYQQGGFTGAGDFGQSMILRSRKHTKLFYIPIRSGKLMHSSLTSSQLESFESNAKPFISGLKDHWDEGFDMMEYEFVHIVAGKDNPQIDQRIRWRFATPCDEHCKIVESYRTLTKEVEVKVDAKQDKDLERAKEIQQKEKDLMKKENKDNKDNKGKKAKNKTKAEDAESE